MDIVQAQQKDMDKVRESFLEYQTWLNSDTCFQNFEDELVSLPGCYKSPQGIIYLAVDKEQVVGCSAIRPRCDKPETEAELKRLFVKDTYRGHSIGKQLFNASMEAAKQIGYEAVVLETLAKMEAAQHLYRDYGFKAMSNYSQSDDTAVESYRYSFDVDA